MLALGEMRALLTLALAAGAAGDTRPNLVFIMADTTGNCNPNEEDKAVAVSSIIVTIINIIRLSGGEGGGVCKKNPL